METLFGKVALVTGGSRGIGAATVRRLAELGADVAFTFSSSTQKADEVLTSVEAFGRRGLGLMADSSDTAALRSAVADTVARLGRLDILVNNAGAFPYGPIENITDDEIDHTFALHVRAVFVASQSALTHMKTDGRIISVGSSFAQRVPYGGVTLYAASKSALIGFTKGLAREVGSRGITVNVVDPGSTDTEMNPANGDGAADELALMAVDHYAQPEDIAATIGHLAGPAGRFITGASIAVDGGVSA